MTNNADETRLSLLSYVVAAREFADALQAALAVNNAEYVQTVLGGVETKDSNGNALDPYKVWVNMTAKLKLITEKK